MMRRDQEHDEKGSRAASEGQPPLRGVLEEFKDDHKS